MGIWQAFRMAVKSIFSNKVRSFLTMLGVIIGVAAVITAVAFAQGSTKQITDRISQLGTELIQVNIFGRNTNRDLTWETLSEFASDNADVIAAVAPQVTGNMTVKAGRNSLSTTIRGTTYDYSVINSQGVSEGRYILDIDSDLRQKVAVIGSRIKDKLFENENPIGKTIKVGEQIFTVVGILEELEDGAENTKDDQIIIPVSTAQRITRNSAIRNYSFLATSPENVKEAMERISEFLTDVYGNENMFRVTNSAQMLDTLNSVTETMMTVLGGIAAISLLVGGIGIMNIMLVSVTERTREIGIRKAVGAKRRNILTQFLIEALLITGLGGAFGLIIGCTAIWGIGKAGLVPAVYSPLWMALSFGISLLVGVIFGMFPANKASKLDPIMALRHE
ncbi:MAG: FtsX-like permease family protein [Clostridiaceae bacterium]|nr:FtsX-like permease family protein [Clostridiaceae bacterium]